MLDSAPDAIHLATASRFGATLVTFHDRLTAAGQSPSATSSDWLN
jgi:predicted nucleic acid-binding protein